MLGQEGNAYFGCATESMVEILESLPGSIGKGSSNKTSFDVTLEGSYFNDNRFIYSETLTECIGISIGSSNPSTSWSMIHTFEDISITINYYIKSYNITLIASPTEGGVLTCNGVSGSTTCISGTFYSFSAIPNNGFKFLKWQRDGVDTNYAQTVSVSFNKDSTLTAVFEAEKYNIKFLDEYGNLLQEGEVSYGETPVYSGSTPTKSSTAQYDYHFSGWSPSITPVTGEASYTAQFNSVLKEYTVNWYNEDGTLLKTDKVKYGYTPQYDGVEPSKTSTAEHSYEFAGWHIEIMPVTGDIDYYAIFNEIDITYTVIWKNDDGRVLETDEKVPYGDMPQFNGSTPAKAPTAQYSYTFLGWDTAVTEVTKDITYTAVYTSTVNKYTVTAEVQYPEGGSVTGAGVYNYGDKVVLTVSTKNGYSFLRWNDKNSDNPREITVEGNINLIAQLNFTTSPIYFDTTDDFSSSHIRSTIGTISTNIISGGLSTNYTETDEYDYCFRPRFYSIIDYIAIPNDGYEFVMWDDGSTNPTKRIIKTESGIEHYIAYFRKTVDYSVEVGNIPAIIIYLGSKQILAFE